MSEQQPEAEGPSRWWWCKYYLKQALHHSTRFASGLASHKFFSLILPWVTGAYFAVLDIFGDAEWFQQNRALTIKLFWACLMSSLVTQFLQGVNSLKPKLESDKTAREIMSEFINSVAFIVESKLSRFRSKLPIVKTGSDKFRHITLPEEQLPVIGDAAGRFLRGAYGLREDQIDITILRRKDDGEWHYSYRLQSWNHGSTKWLSERRSAAHQCSERREVVFFPNKIKSAAAGLFVLSERDKRRKEGSAYIYPMAFDASDHKVDFVISIITYGKQFAEEFDKTSCDITEAFLREICRRFEIELCLDTIKKV